MTDNAVFPEGLDRRTLIGATLALVAPLGACASIRPIRSELVYIGMHGAEIRAARFDAEEGVLTMVGPVAQNLRPTWATRHPSRPVLYFTEESGNDGLSQGGVQAFSVNADTAALVNISDVRAGGGGTTHLWFDRDSATVLASNYGAGSCAALPVGPDGALSDALPPIAMSGSGPHRRQSSPHVHSTAVDPSGRYVLAADLGSDRVWVLPFDPGTRSIGPHDPNAPNHYVAEPGSGPRHIAFHPEGRVLYLINELTAEIETLGWDARAAQLTRLGRVSLNDPAFAGTSSGGEIAISRDARFVYASNRGDHTLVVFSVDAASKRLTRVQKVSSGGERPWHFAIHERGDWLLCANRDANALRLFRVDQATGQLADTGRSLETPSPVHVHFFG